MKANDINVAAPILNYLIHNSIVRSVHFVVKKCEILGNQPQEPDFIASLTINFSAELFNILKAVFPQSKFSITSIFCHQKPLVEIDQNTSTEIGDILFVYVYTDDRGRKKYNSLLLQAKISTKQTTIVAQRDQHQLKLYSDWPQFTYKKAGKLNGTKRDILPKTINDGAQYLLIDNDPIYGLSGMPGTYPMGCATPSHTLSINNDLASEIIDFLKFKSGRAFEQDPKTSKDDWTKMIWDLLIATKEKASRRRNIGLENFSRQSTDQFDGKCFFMTETSSIFEDLHAQLEGENSKIMHDRHVGEEEFSTSVVLIESREEKINERT